MSNVGAAKCKKRIPDFAMMTLSLLLMGGPMAFEHPGKHVDNGFTFPPKMFYEDALFTVQTLLKARRIALIPDHLYYYRKNAGNSITDNEARSQLHRQNFIAIQTASHEALQHAKVSDSVWRYHLELILAQVRMHLGNCSTPEEFDAFFKQAQGLMNFHEYQALQASSRQDILDFAAALHQKDAAKAAELLGICFS